MNDREKRIRQELKDNFVHYASKCLKIRPKDGSIIPFELNRAQKYIHDQVEHQRRLKGKVRAIILKGRQQGCSSYITARFYHKVTHSFGVRAFILTHEQEATNNLFEMTQRYHQHCPALVKPKTDASNAKELLFGGLDSGYKVGTAGNKAVGRSSTIQLLHASEVAYWENANEHAKGVMQAVPEAIGTEIFLESTANGVGNYFHQQWLNAEAGMSEFLPIFIPWFWQEEYQKEYDGFDFDDKEKELVELYSLTNEQIAWRRNKIVELSVNGADGEISFNQEYPNNATEAFALSGENYFIRSQDVMRARNSRYEEKIGKLIIGVDPARFGDDRTAIIRRHGRIAYNLETYKKKDLMEVANLCHQIIINENPFKMCIDIAGLGAGVYDRLKELGHEKVIVPVNGGEVAFNPKIYINRRNEMWCLMKEWLLEHPCRIPNSNQLQTDLCSVMYEIDNLSRVKLEKKEQLKKRGLLSCDTADALALTFSIPQHMLKKDASQEAKVAGTIMSNFMERQRARANRKW